jgi:hypothetical protein
MNVHHARQGEDQMEDQMTTIKMNPEVKELWVTKLLSGEYLQGEGCLCRIVEHEAGKPTSHYCCLGVLSALFPRITWEEADNGRMMAVAGTSDLNYLPDGVRQWAGLPERPLMGQDIQNTLANMNDEGKTFEKIAKFIQDNL